MKNESNTFVIYDQTRSIRHVFSILCLCLGFLGVFATDLVHRSSYTSDVSLGLYVVSIVSFLLLFVVSILLHKEKSVIHISASGLSFEKQKKISPAEFIPKEVVKNVSWKAGKLYASMTDISLLIGTTSGDREIHLFTPSEYRSIDACLRSYGYVIEPALDVFAATVEKNKKEYRSYVRFNLIGWYSIFSVFVVLVAILIFCIVRYPDIIR